MAKSKAHKYCMMLNWIFEHTDEWFDFIGALYACDFRRDEILEMASDECWANSSEEEQEILDCVNHFEHMFYG